MCNVFLTFKRMRTVQKFSGIDVLNNQNRFVSDFSHVLFNELLSVHAFLPPRIRSLPTSRRSKNFMQGFGPKMGGSVAFDGLHSY